MILSRENEKDLRDLPGYVREDMDLILVETLEDVLEDALQPCSKRSKASESRGFRTHRNTLRALRIRNTHVYGRIHDPFAPSESVRRLGRGSFIRTLFEGLARNSRSARGGILAADE